MVLIKERQKIRPSSSVIPMIAGSRVHLMAALLVFVETGSFAPLVADAVC